ncbi:uncharacterized protein N7496_003407 [Penicillium cataractarum]|uniref:Uncharacterized protein n=1 Tax=Penicillium cataractarum TaxID=2100454 RepID=A0A9W9VHH3_9EURO|nr:uncharacterized protein N7496_003407 [Penicillium cataractarum]KAJ5380979.1 hypothetical protein N7496_003407 [Penicillium cataractarum]
MQGPSVWSNGAILRYAYSTLWSAPSAPTRMDMNLDMEMDIFPRTPGSAAHECSQLPGYTTKRNLDAMLSGSMTFTDPIRTQEIALFRFVALARLTLDNRGCSDLS